MTGERMSNRYNALTSRQAEMSKKCQRRGKVATRADALPAAREPSIRHAIFLTHPELFHASISFSGAESSLSRLRPHPCSFKEGGALSRLQLARCFDQRSKSGEGK